MKEKELRNAMQVKNEIINKQSHRITLLEEKFTALRQQYIRLKYEVKKVIPNRRGLF